MAGRRDIRCIGPSYTLPDRKAAVQRAVNLYVREITGLGEDKQAIMYSAAGTQALHDFGVEMRGAYATETREFFVAGSTLYEWVSGAPVARGTLITASGFVGMKHGRDQLVIVDGDNGYVFSLTSNTLARITSSGWRGSRWVEELNGTFIFVATDGVANDQFYISAIDDASQEDALDFSSADAQPDSIVTQRILKQELFLFGDVSTEVWIYDGSADFPLVRYNSTTIDVGAVGPRAVINAADTLVFVGKTKRGTGIVYAMVGHQPQRISNWAVEEALAASTDLSGVTMWARQIAGAEIVGINAPGVATTWCWDAATKEWHEAAALIDGEWQQYPIDQVISVGQAHHGIYGTKAYTVTEAVTNLDGATLARERTWPHLISPSNEAISYGGLELSCTTGHGGTITLELSNDGGFTWGPPLLRSLGAIGRWMQRVRWLALGQARDRVFRLRCTDDVPLAIHAANLDAGPVA